MKTVDKGKIKLRNTEVSKNKSKLKIKKKATHKEEFPIDKITLQNHKASSSKKKQRKKQRDKLKEQLDQDDKQDDVTIYRLEKLMKLSGEKLPPSFANDGLDYLLNVVDGTENMELSSDDEMNDDISYSDDNFGNNSNVEENDDEHNDASELMDSSQEVTLEERKIKKRVRFDLPVDVKKKERKIPLIKSEPGGKKEEDATDSNAPSTVVKSGKYVPPAYRNLDNDDERKKLERIKRQLKGLLNRLTDTNIHSICNDIDSVYKNNSRAIITQVLSDVLLLQFFTPDPIPDKLIIESAMVVAILTHNIGVEVVAHFVETIVKKLQELFLLKNYGEGKECNNALQLICGFYQLKLIQKQLILDIIEKLLNHFTERDVELLVVVLKATGFQLRKDDPVSLKTIVERVTSKSMEADLEQSPRMKFMVEMVTAIKNNNVRKVLDYDVDAINNRRKRIKTICDKEAEAFADVTFSDLSNADTQGRWWVVGSSWGGTPMLQQSKVEADYEVNVSDKVKKAGRKLRMNTDVRKRIFYSVMGANDFVDAFDTVTSLGLKGKQTREVSHVLMTCCQEEKTFNPYYYHLLNKFCHSNREFIMSLQCAFWDRFKSLQSLSNKNLLNLTKLLSSLLLSEALPLSCLKAIELTEIDKVGVMFLRKVFSNIATDARSVSEMDKVFKKLDSTKYSSVRNGVRLFIQHFMLKDVSYMRDNEDIKEALSRMDRLLDSQRQFYLQDGFL